MSLLKIFWIPLLLWLTTSGIGKHSTSPFLLPSLGQSMDLLGALGSYNKSWVGVTLTDNISKDIRPTYILQGTYRDLKLPPSSFQEVSDILRRNPEFTISARIKQEPGNIGAIISFAHGSNRYLELQSSGRKNEIRFHYTSRLDSKVYIETFHYKLADDKWHNIAVSVSGSQVEFLVDCESRFKRILKPGMPNRNFSEPVRLWLGQRNIHYYYKGAMQEIWLIGGPHGYLSSCPNLDSSCPTCGQFYLLESAVQELTRYLQDLSKKLEAVEKRIEKIEDCDCQKSCVVNGTVHADGATWQNSCLLCACTHGDIHCRPVECPELPCKHPVYKNGECCQSCLRHCLFYGQFYDHGDIVTIKKCVECQCNDGSMKCIRTDPELNCPKLTCPHDQQFNVPDHCCKFCPGVDYCSKGHVCHQNATCINLQTTYACQCNPGFQGDGRSRCTDIDECQKEGGLEGHHCNQNTVCVNSNGSYFCDCLRGYKRINKFNCAELDECSSGQHKCDINAICINTQGSYNCVCKEGYNGDGYNCQPICEPNCLNGGICRSPGKCSCPNGYIGSRCERDLDECTTNSHKCTNASTCVNMIGWYYCQCRQGYENLFIDNNLGSRCSDINECLSGLHTCHPSAQCINIEGSFKCECPYNKLNCKLSCVFEGSEISHGVSVFSKHDPCQVCNCNLGVVTCERPRCNCSNSNSDKNPCCPKCNENYACQHQELPGVFLLHGEQWSYQCQTCECLYGEIDCWEMKCPPLLCDNPIRNAMDCCPHCNDACLVGNLSTSMQACTLTDGEYWSAKSQFVKPNDTSTACNCKVPYCEDLVSNVACCIPRLKCFAVVITVAALHILWNIMEWWILYQLQIDSITEFPVVVYKRPLMLRSSLVIFYKWVVITNILYILTRGTIRLIHLRQQSEKTATSHIRANNIVFYTWL